MAIIVWLVIGGAIGVAAILVQRVETAAGRALNIAAAVLGAVAGGVAAGRGEIGADPWRTTALIVAVAGAVILVGIANLFRHRPPA